MTELRYASDILSGLLAIVSYFPYITAILRGETKPARSSWLIWTGLSWLTGAGMFASETLNYQILIIMVGDLYVVGLAVKYGMPGWSRLDTICICGAIIGVAAWYYTKNPTVGLVIVLLVTFVGSVPTIVKTWHHPDKEDRTAYALMTTSCIFALLSISQWSIASAGQPLTFLCAAGIVLALTYRQKRMIRSA